MSYGISPSLSDLIHSIWCSVGPSMLLQMALFHSFYDWIIIFHCVYIYICICIYVHTHTHTHPISFLSKYFLWNTVKSWYTFRIIRMWLNFAEFNFLLFSCSVMSNSLPLMDYSLPGYSVHGISPGRNTGVGCHFLLQGIFLTQRSNQSLLHWQADSLLMSHREVI